LRPDKHAVHWGLAAVEIGIPPGVGHGYKILGDKPAQLVYAMDRYYNPHDEGRIPLDDPGINYD
jgi:dTDP-4-dehydrorhamnose 3,5-epimerase